MSPPTVQHSSKTAPEKPDTDAASTEFREVCLEPGTRILITRPSTHPRAWEPGERFNPGEQPGMWITLRSRTLITGQSDSTSTESGQEEIPSSAEFSGVCPAPGTCIIVTRLTSVCEPADDSDPAEYSSLWIIPDQVHILISEQPADTAPEAGLSRNSKTVTADLCAAVSDRISSSEHWRPPSGISPAYGRPEPPELLGLLRQPGQTRLIRPKKRRSSWQLLEDPDFGPYFFGSLGSNLGTWLQSTAQVLIAYQVTHSIFMVGLITSAQFAGMIVVSPWAAVLADRSSPRAVLVGTQCASAVIAAWMAWRYAAGMLGVHSLISGALALGFVYALALPVQTALVPTLVAESDAADAVKMSSVSYNAGRALAPALSVLLIATTGPYMIFSLNALSFVIFAIVLRRLKGVASDRSLHMIAIGILGRLGRVFIDTIVRGVCAVLSACASAHSRVNRTVGNILLLTVFAATYRWPWSAARHAPKGSYGRPRARVTDGISIALRNHRILLLLAIVAAVTLADDPILVLSPALAHTRLGTSGEWAGYFIAALGWGSVLGSLPPTSTGAGTQRASRRAALSLLVLGVSVVVFTMGFSIGISLVAAFIAGGASLFTGAAAQTALLKHQRATGANFVSVASVAALWAVAWAGTKPIASFSDGWLGSHIGIVPTSILLAIPAVMIAVGELLLPNRAKKAIKVWAAERLRTCTAAHLGFSLSEPERTYPESELPENSHASSSKKDLHRHMGARPNSTPPQDMPNDAVLQRL